MVNAIKRLNLKMNFHALQIMEMLAFLHIEPSQSLAKQNLDSLQCLVVLHHRIANSWIEQG